MRHLSKGLLAVGGGALACWIGWGLYVNRTTERVPYESVATVGDVEIRRYPRTVLVETTADSNEEAFRRLFRYISGANESSEDVEMTAPVASDADEASSGESVSMTTPVRTDRAADERESNEDVSMTAPVRTTGDGGDVTMSFYLPADYTPATAPTPTDSRVRLVVQPSQTLAVKAFSWYATDGRVAKQQSALLDTLAEHDVDRRGDPFLLQYNDPFTPPFMRRNEVAVAVRYDEETGDE